MAKAADSAQSAHDKEAWLPVVGWEGLYEVSNLGRVRSLDRIVAVRCGCGHGFIERDVRGRLLKAVPSTSLDYPSVVLADHGRKDRQLVHRLVCRAFNGPPPPGKNIVAHNDGNPANSCASNLRWATVRENAWDTFRHGKLRRGIDAFGAKITDEDVQYIRRNANDDPRDMARKFGVEANHIRRIIRGENRAIPSSPDWDGPWLVKGDRHPRWGLTKADKQYILNNPDNLRVAELANKFGITDKRIYQLRSDHKEQRGERNAYSKHDVDLIINNPSGLSNIELGRQLGVTAKQVAQIRYWRKNH